jgi:hypothetical protein
MFGVFITMITKSYLKFTTTFVEQINNVRKSFIRI